jgi:ribosome-associated protein
MTRVNEERPSKSARKREQLALQALGEKLVELPVGDLEAIGLDAALFDAIVEAKSMRAHGALRRQRQLIGKLMRGADAAHIESVLVSLGSHDRAAVEVFHAAEAWRDRILDEGAPALAEFERLASAAQPQISALLREYEKANETGRRTARRRLFREIHGQLGKMEANKCATEATRP